MNKTTIDYYEKNAQDFYDGTINVQMDALYQQFLPLIINGGHILDAGCGSGRDALNFKKNGYQVTAFDASKQLCEKATILLGQPVLNLTFDEIDQVNEFDGIWACASLLHVEFEHLPIILDKLLTSLKPQGVIYASFKYGQENSRVKDQRIFTDMTEEKLSSVATSLKTPVYYSTWISEDQRADKKEQWLNVIFTFDKQK